MLSDERIHINWIEGPPKETGECWCQHIDSQEIRHGSYNGKYFTHGLPSSCYVWESSYIARHAKQGH